MKILISITRFAGHLKEAISKNSVLLAEQIHLRDEASVTTYTPLDYETSGEQTKIVFSENQHYDSWKDNMSNLYTIAKFLNKTHEEYDVLNLHIGPLYELFLLKQLLDKPVIDKLVITIWQPYLETKEIVDNKSYYLKNSYENKHQFVLNSALLHPFYKRGLNAFRYFVVQTEYQKHQIAKLINGDRVKVIPNGLPVVELDENREIEDRGDVKKLLYVGHMKTSKGCDIIIKLLARIVKECKVKLTIATSGRGNQKEILGLIDQFGLEPYVEWKGKVNVYEEIDSADAFVALYQSSVGTSYYPNVLLESLAVGTPLITTAKGAIPEIIKHNETGLLIHPDKLEEGARSIINLLNNKELAANISRNQKKLFQEKFLVSKAVDSYMDQFEQVCNKVSC